MCCLCSLTQPFITAGTGNWRKPDPKCIPKRAVEAFGILLEIGLGVALSWISQGTAKDVRPIISYIGVAYLRDGTEVDLQFFARPDFHAEKGGLVAGFQRFDEPTTGQYLPPKLWSASRSWWMRLADVTVHGQASSRLRSRPGFRFGVVGLTRDHWFRERPSESRPIFQIITGLRTVTSRPEVSPPRSTPIRRPTRLVPWYCLTQGTVNASGRLRITNRASERPAFRNSQRIVNCCLQETCPSPVDSRSGPRRQAFGGESQPSDKN